MKNLVNDIVAADRRIKAVDGGARETPLDESGIFSDRTGAGFLLKGEHLQRTGSFKMRGAMNTIRCLDDADRERGIITASSGNHGMATTQAARVGGVDVTIYLPESVSPPEAREHEAVRHEHGPGAGQRRRGGKGRAGSGGTGG